MDLLLMYSFPHYQHHGNWLYSSKPLHVKPLLGQCHLVCVMVLVVPVGQGIYSMSNHDPPRSYSLFSHSNKFRTLGQLPHSLTSFFSGSRLDSRALGQHIDTKAATSRCGSCTLSFHPLSVSPLCTYTSSIHPPSPAPPRSVLQAQLNGYRQLPR